MRRVLVLLVALVIVIGVGYVATPYARAGALIVRVANVGGRAGSLAGRFARTVTIDEGHEVPTRYGKVAARFYRPEGGSRRSMLMIPGIHSMGIDEPRLKVLAQQMAGSGLTV